MLGIVLSTCDSVDIVKTAPIVFVNRISHVIYVYI